MAQLEEIAKIPLIEERIAISKREVETGRFRVRVAVDTHEERFDTELSRDEIEIKRIPRNVSLSDVPSVRIESGTTIIPVVEEEVIVEKRLILVEEIHVTRCTTRTREEIPVVVRAERAKIERLGPETGDAARGIAE